MPDSLGTAAKMEEALFSDPKPAKWEQLELVRQRPVKDEMSEPPSEEELNRAIGKLRSGKAAGGETGFLPEMVKAVCHEEAFTSSLMSLCGVPRDWCDVVLIPLLKKGDRSVCDNWKGISLLDVVGKVVARVIQERLQKLAKDQLPESQCGFRKGRGCADMIFTVIQLVKKADKKRHKCADKRNNPLSQQKGAVKCISCYKWFGSRVSQ